MMTKLERHEKRWRERNWHYFATTIKGRMSWADWFHRMRSRRDAD